MYHDYADGSFQFFQCLLCHYSFGWLVSGFHISPKEKQLSAHISVANLRFIRSFPIIAFQGLCSAAGIVGVCQVLL